jgi:predicted ester cyclase
VSAASGYLEGTQGPYRDLVDYILGITHEIWESRQVDRIRDYYADDTLIYTLSGLVRGASAIVQNTHDTLRAFPDRLLLGDAVVWSREGPGVFYSSHRITSPMTNSGDSAFGPATGRAVRVTTIADCLVERGVITREWLVRDNYGLVRQLGFDPHRIAQRAAAMPLGTEFADWMAAESERIGTQGRSDTLAGGTTRLEWSPDQAPDFALSVLSAAWRGAAIARSPYATYAVLHDSAPIASGRAAIETHFAGLRAALGDVALVVDHCCVRPADEGQFDIAARWMLRGTHRGEWLGVPATQKPLLVLGVTHWRIVAGQIAAEWSIYDRMAILAQMLRGRD